MSVNDNIYIMFNNNTYIPYPDLFNLTDKNIKETNKTFMCKYLSKSDSKKLTLQQLLNDRSPRIVKKNRYDKYHKIIEALINNDPSMQEEKKKQLYNILESIDILKDRIKT